MPACFPVPTRSTLEGVLGTLVASPIKIQLAHDVEHERDTPGVFAEYVDDRDELCVLAFANHVLVNLLGGALVDIPQNVVEEATSKFVMNEGCLDGFREIANVLASSLNSSVPPGPARGAGYRVTRGTRRGVTQIERPVRGHPVCRRRMRLHQLPNSCR